MRNTSQKQLKKHGIVAVLAMLFLALFATLALGVYATTVTNAVVANNERSGTISLTAAESGMDFIRYQLSLIKVPPSTPQDQVFSYVSGQLKTALEGTPNLGSNSVAVSSTSVSIPSNPNNFIKLDNTG